MKCYWCGNKIIGDPHTDPFSGEDCCAECCPRCNSAMNDAKECKCGSSRQIFDKTLGGGLVCVECTNCRRRGPVEMTDEAAVKGWNE